MRRTVSAKNLPPWRPSQLVPAQSAGLSSETGAEKCLFPSGNPECFGPGQFEAVLSVGLCIRSMEARRRRRKSEKLQAAVRIGNCPCPATPKSSDSMKPSTARRIPWKTSTFPNAVSRCRPEGVRLGQSPKSIATPRTAVRRDAFCRRLPDPPLSNGKSRCLWQCACRPNAPAGGGTVLRTKTESRRTQGRTTGCEGRGFA